MQKNKKEIANKRSFIFKFQQQKKYFVKSSLQKYDLAFRATKV